MMNQREAVYQAVVTVVGTNEIKEAVKLDTKQKELVHAIVVQAFLRGEVELKGDHSPEWIKKYVPGLVNNWCRKDKRLNGNVKYEAKNPGSRTGSGDEALRQMKALLAITTDPEARKDIEEAIAERVAELKPKLEIDTTLLPAHLVRFVPPAVRKATPTTEE